jgi:hypothetical protein
MNALLFTVLCLLTSRDTLIVLELLSGGELKRIIGQQVIWLDWINVCAVISGIPYVLALIMELYLLMIHKL